MSANSHMTFADVVRTNPPRLVVMCQISEDRTKQRFQWGLVGSVPILNLIGGIIRAQAELPLIEPADDRHSCPEPAFVLAWDDTARKLNLFVSPDVPVDPLVGMLETIKTALVMSRYAQQAASHRVQVLGPDGTPMQG